MQREIEGHPDYAITDTGDVISYKGREPRILIPYYSGSYPKVTIDNEKRYVADLVAEAFLGSPINPSYKIFYIDGDKSNCNVNNLAWLSQSDIQLYSQFTLEYRKQLLKR